MCSQSVVMTVRSGSLYCMLPLMLLAMGCSSERKPANELKVIPFTGVVLVDGSPLAGVKIKMYSKTQDREKRAFPRGVTDEEGRFHAWTYRVNDGVPPGEYVVTFIDHSKADPKRRENPDGFQGKYANRNGTEHVVTVSESDEQFDMGEIPLSRP